MVGTIVEGRKVEVDEWLFPCAGSLPMGHSWSLFFAQDAVENVLRRSDLLREARLWNDASGGISLREALSSSLWKYVYVDNVGVLGTDPSQVRRGLAEAERVLNAAGLATHESEFTTERATTLGVHLDFELCRTELTLKRLWRTRRAIRALLRRRLVSGQALEILVGHATFCAMVNRNLMSCFHATYAYSRRHYREPARLWTSVVDELRSFVGLLSLCRTDWWPDWCPRSRPLTPACTDSALPRLRGRMKISSRWARSANGTATDESPSPPANTRYTPRDWRRSAETTASRS
jgi:hypothetical protein